MKLIELILCVCMYVNVFNASDEIFIQMFVFCAEVPCLEEMIDNRQRKLSFSPDAAMI